MTESLILIGMISPLYVFVVTLYYKLGRIEGKLNQIINGKK